MAFADLDNVRIHYELTGKAGLPVLVLSNSLGVNLSMWKPQVEAFSAHSQVLRYDTRGHGQSSVPRGPYAIDDLGGDVLGLLDTLEIKRASFCGLSMGGSTGQWLGIHAADRIDKLILANTAAKIGEAEIWNVRIAVALSEGLETIIPGTLERWFTPEFRAANPEVVANTKAMLEATNVQGYAACSAAIRDSDFRATLSAITIPTLVISGRHDPVTPPENGRTLAAAIPGALYVELEAAHLSNLEALTEFNAAVTTFLAN